MARRQGSAWKCRDHGKIPCVLRSDNGHPSRHHPCMRQKTVSILGNSKIKRGRYAAAAQHHAGCKRARKANGRDRTAAGPGPHCPTDAQCRFSYPNFAYVASRRFGTKPRRQIPKRNNRERQPREPQKNNCLCNDGIIPKGIITQTHDRSRSLPGRTNSRPMRTLEWKNSQVPVAVPDQQGRYQPLPVISDFA